MSSAAPNRGSSLSQKGFARLPEDSPKSDNHGDVKIPMAPTFTVTSPEGGANKTVSFADEKPRLQGFRRRGHRSNSDTDISNESAHLNKVGLFYQKVKNFSIITRYLIYVLPLGFLIAIPIIVGATAAPKAKIGNVSMLWFFVWIEVIWLSLWVSKVIAHFIPRVFQTLVGIVSPGTRKYALVIQNVEIPLSLVGWAVTSLATFAPLMTQNPEAKKRPATTFLPWMGVVRQILAACVVASLIFLAECVIIQLISINYHRRQMNLRVKKTKMELDSITDLFEASTHISPLRCQEFHDLDNIILRNNTATKAGSPQQSGANTPLALIRNVGGMVTDAVGTVAGQVASEVTGKNIDPRSARAMVTNALEKDKSATALAERIWITIACEGKKGVYLQDLEEVLGEHRKARAKEIFSLLDVDSNGDVSVEELIEIVTGLGRERKSITNSLHDVGQAIASLDNLLCTVVFIITIFIFVAFLNQSFATTLATAGTALLSLSFVFAVTCQEILGSCIFLFVKHPYDVGDKVEISKECLFVEHISLLYTEFRRASNSTFVQIPNSILNTLWVENISRSKPQNESITLSIAFDTPLDSIRCLQQELAAFVSSDDHRRDFLPDIDTEVTGVSDLSQLDLRVGFAYRSNWANGALKASRRNKFLIHLIHILREVPIYGPGGGGAGLGEVSNPAFNVSLTPDQAALKKAEAEAAAEEKKAKPLQVTPYPSSLGVTSSATAASAGAFMISRSLSIGRRRSNASQVQ